ncbi:MAG: polyphosphate kinase 1 [Actinomycetes bacterium]
MNEPTETLRQELENITNGAKPVVLDDPSLYTNREVSWMDFDTRVLELAEDPEVPLLERAKFLAITATNLDEFVMVRLAGLHEQIDSGIDARGPDGLSPDDAFDRVSERMKELMERHSRAWEREVRPELAAAGIRIIEPEKLGPSDLADIDRDFAERIFPVLTPLADAPGRPFPYISTLSLSIAVRLHDPITDGDAFARVKVPREVIERFVPAGRGVFVPLELVIARHLSELFPGVEIVSHSLFRVTRDADFTVSDEADDLLQAVEEELRRRRFGEAIRLEVAEGMDPVLRGWLTEQLDLEEDEVHTIKGLLDLGDLWQIHGLRGFEDLRDPAWSPVVPQALRGREGEPIDIFSAIRRGSIVIHHPYESFAASVERLAKQAAKDPKVLAIKQTVYRTSDDSKLVPSLVEAAEQGKQAVSVVEVKARFDEIENIGWVRTLEESGAHVCHGLPGLKTHAKALMVVRREGKGVRRYVHIGTGNYNAKTARTYEDFGLLTADPDIAEDVSDLFNMLTGYARPAEFRKVAISPDGIRNKIIEEIEATVAAHRAGRRARIRLKMNALVDRKSIEALYRASQAGVRIELLVRGICCLVPGVPGVSETITVRSIVGRFLEHSRIYCFERGEERSIWIGSADLMPRNLDSRVELIVPIEEAALQDRLAESLDRSMTDDTYAWELGRDRIWTRRTGKTRSLHDELTARAAD